MTSVAEIGDGLDAEFGDGGGDERGGEAFADAGDGVEGARGEFAEQRGAAEEAVEFVENFFQGGGDGSAMLWIVDQGIERGEMLGAELSGQGEEILFAGFGLLGGLDQAIGDAGHRGDDDGDGALGGGGVHDRGGAADAGGVADGGAAKFHYAERRAHWCRLPWVIEVSIVLNCSVWRGAFASGVRSGASWS